MLCLTVSNPDLKLSTDQLQRVQFWLLEFLPARRLLVRQGPPVQFVVAERYRPGDLAPGLQARVEEICGCAVEVSGDQAQ